jgi:Ran GTPase-activating protein (RanGAP) involved in mRNA processing and transport
VGNSIDDSICQSLSEALCKALPPLRELNLSRNNISDRGAASIAEFIQVNHHIRVLKISWNKI